MTVRSGSRQYERRELRGKRNAGGGKEAAEARDEEEEEDVEDVEDEEDEEEEDEEEDDDEEEEDDEGGGARGGRGAAADAGDRKRKRRKSAFGRSSVGGRGRARRRVGEEEEEEDEEEEAEGEDDDDAAEEAGRGAQAPQPREKAVPAGREGASGRRASKAAPKAAAGEASASPFQQGEKVLAFHGELLYYAKILEVEQDAAGQHSFFIHYMGWKKSWDEWVGTERLLKDTAANERKKAELEKGHGLGQHSGHRQHQASGQQGRKGTKEAVASANKASAKESRTAASVRAGRPKATATSPIAATPVASGGRPTKPSRSRGRTTSGGDKGSGSGDEAKPEEGRAKEHVEDVAERKPSPAQPQSSGPSQQRSASGRATAAEAVERAQQGGAHQDTQDTTRPLPRKDGAPAAAPTVRELSISIPLPLKKQLVADEEMIVHKAELLNLPASPCVREILDMFLAEHNREASGTQPPSPGPARRGGQGQAGDAVEGLEDVMRGLKEYFDRTLPLMLLYRQERQQYMDHFPHGSTTGTNAGFNGASAGTDASARAQPEANSASGAAETQAGSGTEASAPGGAAAKAALLPSDVYGGEHLLRLFTKLPSMMGYLQMEEETRTELQAHLSLLLKFMARNQASLFMRASRYVKVEAKDGTWNGAGEKDGRQATVSEKGVLRPTKRS